MAAVNPPEATSSASEQLRTVILKTMTLSRRDPFNITVQISLDSSIAQLKDMVKESLETHPEHSSQRIIYQGRQLTDALIIRNVVGTTIVG